MPLPPIAFWILNSPVFFTGVLGFFWIRYAYRTGRLKLPPCNALRFSADSVRLLRDQEREPAVQDWFSGEWSYDLATGKISADPVVFQMFSEPKVRDLSLGRPQLAVR